MQARQITGFVFFEHTDGRHSGFNLDFVIPSNEPNEFDVSILGTNIILAGELRLNARSIELDLPILGA